MVVSAFRPEERGKALGINITGVYIGLSLSPVLGGILNYNLGWRSVVLFGVPFLFVILVLLLYKIDEEWITFDEVALDLKGSFAYGIGMVLFMYGFTILNEPLGAVLTFMGIIVLIIFGIIELRQENPVFDIRFLKIEAFFHQISHHYALILQLLRLPPFSIIIFNTSKDLIHSMQD